MLSCTQMVNSRKEAEEALLIYLCDHNEKCDDSSYLSPFDFTVEEVDVKLVNNLKTFTIKFSCNQHILEIILIKGIHNSMDRVTVF